MISFQYVRIHFRYFIWVNFISPLHEDEILKMLKLNSLAYLFKKMFCIMKYLRDIL